MRRYFSLVACCTAAALLSCALSFFYSRRAYAQSTSRPVTPFVASFTTKYFAPDGSLRRTTVTRYARFSDHSYTATTDQAYPSARPSTAYIADLATGHEVIIDPLTSSMMTLHYSPSGLRNRVMARDAESCGNIDVAASPSGGEYFGHRTVRYVEHLGSNLTNERTMIPELECFTVKETTDAVSGARDETEVSSLREGDPPEQYRFPSSGLTERAPAEVERLHADVSGGDGFLGGRFARRLSDEYSKRR